jgi:sugar phosphate isomerase/epimerase
MSSRDPGWAVCDRRQFLQACAGAAILTGTSGAALAAAADQKPPAASEGTSMKKAICHYSFHRRYAAEKWDPDRLAQEVQTLGIEGIDYHARLVGKTDDAMAEAIRAAVKKHGLVLSSLSLGTNFNRPKADEFKAEVEAAAACIRFAAGVKAPVSRVFGGSMSAAERKDAAAGAAARQRMTDGLAAIAQVAAESGVVLGLENHGGLPCTAEEQIQTLQAVQSPHLRATIDVGNYLQGGQEGHIATALVAPYAAYVHFKDCKKVPDASKPWGYTTKGVALGEGDVNLAACVDALRKAGYKGFVALEYEGGEDETTGVPKSVAVLKRLVT